MREPVRWLAAALLVATSACGPAISDESGAATSSIPVTTEPPGSTTAPPPSTSTSTTVAASTTTTEAGVELASDRFAVAFTLTGESNWTLFEQNDFMAEITNEGSGVEGERDKIYFTTLQPDGSGWVDLLNGSPHLETGEVEDTEVGGAAAQAINTSLLTGLNSQDTGCSGGPSGTCLVAALDAPTSIGVVIREGMAYRVWIVDVNGTNVAIVAESQAARSTEWIATVEKALQGLSWVG